MKTTELRFLVYKMSIQLIENRGHLTPEMTNDLSVMKEFLVKFPEEIRPTLTKFQDEHDYHLNLSREPLRIAESFEYVIKSISDVQRKVNDNLAQL